MCACFQIEPKSQFMYSFHGSMVDRPHTIRGGGRVQSQAHSLHLNLGSLHHKMKVRVVKIREAFKNQFYPRFLRI